MTSRGLRRSAFLPRGTLKQAALLAAALLVAYPFYFMVSTSFKDFFEATTTPPTFFPTVLPGNRKAGFRWTLLRQHDPGLYRDDVGERWPSS